MGTAEGREGAAVTEKGEKESRTHRGMQKENIYPKPLAWNMRGADFHEFLKPVRLKAHNFKG